MTQIDKTKPVLVTGANGYVASWAVKKIIGKRHNGSRRSS